jgi:LAGLIDADG endonuclease
MTNLNLIVLLYNGNMVFPARIARFSSFLTAFNLKYAKYYQPIIMINNNVRPTINDAWILGIVDSEGCFSCSFLNNSNAFRIRFQVAQTGLDNKIILDHLIQVFGIGVVYPHSYIDTYEYVVIGWKNCLKVFDYFDKFILKTKKRQSYLLWREIHRDIGLKLHLNPIQRARLKLLAAKVNKK